ncbi:MAG: hypothetical protein ACUVYA_05350 [Planctomycetota bacterium]
MISKFEKFWIAFILRFGFGFFFLIAAINIFTYGVNNFSTDLSKGFEPTWLGRLTFQDTVFGPIVGDLNGMYLVKTFLAVMPYLMAALSVPILTGILYKPALRISAIVLLCFGIGKYIQQDISTTAADFLFAFIICAGLYALAVEKQASEKRAAEAQGGPPRKA